MRRNYRSIDSTIRRSAGRTSLNEIRRRTGIGYAVIEARAQRLGISLLPATPATSADRFLGRSA